MRTNCKFCGIASLDGGPCCTDEFKRDVVMRADVVFQMPAVDAGPLAKLQLEAMHRLLAPVLEAAAFAPGQEKAEDAIKRLLGQWRSGIEPRVLSVAEADNAELRARVEESDVRILSAMKEITDMKLEREQLRARVEEQDNEVCRLTDELEHARTHLVLSRTRCCPACSAKDEALADLRLVVWANTEETWISFTRSRSGWWFNEYTEGPLDDRETPLGTDEHGMPVLTPEVRAALLSARGGA